MQMFLKYAMVPKRFEAADLSPLALFQACVMRYSCTWSLAVVPTSLARQGHNWVIASHAHLKASKATGAR